MSTELNLGDKSVSVWMILAFIAGIVTFITLFLTWETMALAESGDANISALDMLTGEKIKDIEMSYSFLSKLPFIVALLGIIGAIVAIVPTFVEGKNKEFSIVVAVIFIIALILCIVFFATAIGANLFDGEWKEIIQSYIDLGIISLKAGVGLWIALVASIVGVIGAGLSVKDNL